VLGEDSDSYCIFSVTKVMVAADVGVKLAEFTLVATDGVLALGLLGLVVF
jgi:hypothetical protein